MDADALTKAIDNALTQVLLRLPTERGEDSIPRDFEEAVLEHDVSINVQQVLEAQPEFSTPKLFNSLMGGSGFHPQWVAPMLLREARRRKSAVAAVDWLVKVLNTIEGDALAVATLWGPKQIEQSVQLVDDVQLMSFQDLPPSKQKDALQQRQTLRPQVNVPTFMWGTPTAALVRPLHVGSILVDAADFKPLAGAAETTSLLDDVRLCLGISGPITTIPGPSWFQYLDPDLEAAIAGFGTQYRTHEITPMLELPRICESPNLRLLRPHHRL